VYAEHADGSTTGPYQDVPDYGDRDVSVQLAGALNVALDSVLGK
jgi:hypothetical protein